LTVSTKSGGAFGHGGCYKTGVRDKHLSKQENTGKNIFRTMGKTQGGPGAGGHQEGWGQKKYEKKTFSARKTFFGGRGGGTGGGKKVESQKGHIKTPKRNHTIITTQ